MLEKPPGKFGKSGEREKESVSERCGKLVWHRMARLGHRMAWYARFWQGRFWQGMPGLALPVEYLMFIDFEIDIEIEIEI